MNAAARLASDSSASDSIPTEPVIRQAVSFKISVTIAAATDNHA
jgi:hypothetical protein